MGNISLEVLAAAELELRRRAEAEYTVVGFVDPEKGHTHSLSNQNGEWEFTDEETHIFFPAILEPLLITPKRFKIIIGGRGSAKSQSTGGMCLIDAQDQGLKTGCFREFQNSIEDSVHSLLKDEIARIGLKGFTATNNKIAHAIHGDVFKFRGLARNPDAMKSMNGFKRFWVEEAQTISKESLRLLTPTLREDDSEIWMSANPMSSADPFSERFINPFQRELERDGYYEDDMHLIIVCNYKDNPFFPDVLEQERLFDKEHLPTAEYEHIWLGKFNDQVEGSIIPVDWFNTCIDAHEKLGFQPQGIKIVAHDPSDEGPDPKGLACRHGSVIIDVQEKTDGDANAGADWAALYAIDAKADVFRWDVGGMGISLKRQITTALDGKNIDIDMFNGAETPAFPDEIYQPDSTIDRLDSKTNKEVFRNKRAQFYWMLRDRIYATFRAVTLKLYTDPEKMISFSSSITIIDRVRSEVCRIPKKYNANGLIQIMSKEEMAKLTPPIKSPNLADSIMMTMPAHSRRYHYQTTARPVQTQTSAGWT